MIAALLRNFFKILSAVVVFCTVLSYLAPYVHPRWFSPLAHFATLFPWLILLNLGFIVFWAVNKNRFAFYHFLILVIGWIHITAFVGFSSPQPKSSKSITVLSHNLGTYLAGKNFLPQWEKATTEYIEYLKQYGDPDVVCIQEAAPVLRDLLIKKSGYPHHYLVGTKGNFTLSRFPLTAGADIPFEQTGNCALWTEIEVGKQKICVYNLHLQSNYVTLQTDQLLKSGEIEKKSSWLNIRSVFSRIGKNTIKRASQAELVAQSMRRQKQPILVCGDFNDTPNSYVYRVVSDGLQDAFREKGRGLGHTFAGSLPLLRIDYALASPHFVVTDAGVIHHKIADHYATYMVIELK
jgi:endonuclease/exonuclease/phosphatase family metal-dependent hydrolase